MKTIKNKIDLMISDIQQGMPTYLFSDIDTKIYWKLRKRSEKIVSKFQRSEAEKQLWLEV